MSTSLATDGRKVTWCEGMDIDHVRSEACQRILHKYWVSGSYYFLSYFYVKKVTVRALLSSQLWSRTMVDQETSRITKRHHDHRYRHHWATRNKRPLTNQVKKYNAHTCSYILVSLSIACTVSLNFSNCCRTWLQSGLAAIIAYPLGKTSSRALTRLSEEGWVNVKLRLDGILDSRWAMRDNMSSALWGL